MVSVARRMFSFLGQFFHKLWHNTDLCNIWNGDIRVCDWRWDLPARSGKALAIGMYTLLSAWINDGDWIND